MNSKSFVSVALVVAFTMLVCPVFAASMTRHTLEREATASDLYDSVNDRTMIIACAEGYLMAEAGKMKEERKAIVKVSIRNHDETVYWTNEPTGKALTNGEFKWSMNRVTLSTTVNFFGNMVPLTARWDAIDAPEPLHENEWISSDWHSLINGLPRDAVATVRLGDMTFNTDSGSYHVLIIHHVMMDLIKRAR